VTLCRSGNFTHAGKLIHRLLLRQIPSLGHLVVLNEPEAVDELYSRISFRGLFCHESKPEQVSQLRNQGSSWRQIAKALGIGTATAMRLIRLSDEARPNTQHVRPKTADEIT
jgi:hypothetical protein